MSFQDAQKESFWKNRLAKVEYFFSL